MKCQADGRFCGNRAPIENTDKIEIARWVERETLRLKKMGVSSFETIADLLTRCGRGQHVPTVVPPDGATFPQHQPDGMLESLSPANGEGAKPRSSRT